jgi:AcrR family transcriptional regulator
MNDRSPAVLIADTGRGNEAAILNAALDAFGAEGFNGASMRTVARRAGTSLSNLYNYFPSKSGLLAEVLRHANDELSARIRRAVDDAGDSAGPRMREAVRAYVGFVVDHQVAMLVSTSEVRYLGGEDRDRLIAERRTDHHPGRRGPGVPHALPGGRRPRHPLDGRGDRHLVPARGPALPGPARRAARPLRARPSRSPARALVANVRSCRVTPGR